MKKIYFTLAALLFIPLFGHAQIIETSTSTHSDGDTHARLFTLCSQNAIENRDTAITEARATYNTAMTDIVTKRKEKEKAAVALLNASEKKAAIKTAVELYRKESLVAQDALTDARKIIWSTFEADVQACREEKEGKATTTTDVTANTMSAARSMKVEITEEKEENKTLRESLKSGIDAIKSLFSK